MGDQRERSFESTLNINYWGKYFCPRNDRLSHNNDTYFSKEFINFDRCLNVSQTIFDESRNEKKPLMENNYNKNNNITNNDNHK